MPYDGDPHHWAPEPVKPAKKISFWKTLLRAILWPKLVFERDLSDGEKFLVWIPFVELLSHIGISTFLWCAANPFTEENATWWLWFAPAVVFFYLLGAVCSLFVRIRLKKELVPAHT